MHKIQHRSTRTISHTQSTQTDHDSDNACDGASRG